MKNLLSLLSILILIILIGSCGKTIININESDCTCETCHDTIIIVDTVIVIDTVITIDTIIVIDTVIIIDTVNLYNIVMQPNSISGKDAVIHSLDLFTSGSSEYFWASAWTWNGGNVGVMRALLGFDLNQIPSNAVILDARLSLYGKKSAPDQHSTFDVYGTYNTTYIKKITSQWDENTVSWNNQPATTEQNQVMLAYSTSPNQNYLGIDVKLIVEDIVTNPENGFGFMLQLYEEVYYRSMAFATSDNEDAMLRPKLEVSYILE